MAAKHILSLEVPDVANCEILRIYDTSTYADNLGIDCPELLITPPGFHQSALIKVTPKFDVNITACALEVSNAPVPTPLQSTNCGTKRVQLQDGIYIIRYSVSPNDKVYVEYNYLRTTVLLSTYYRKLCELDITPCEPDSTRKELLSEMKYIRTLIDAAKAKVEYCQSPNEGMELYNFAKKKLEKITCDVCC
jgi:hypothetical protein